MTVICRTSIVILTCPLLICWLSPCSGHSGVRIPRLVLVSMDGFRWDYLNKLPEKDLPTFNFLRKNGAWAKEGMKNAFITKTLPNHVTLITGLYEETHGMVANEFYDPSFEEVYEVSNPNQMVESKWYDTGAEPIWVTNQKANPARRSGSVFWPGCGSVEKGYLPSKYLMYNREMDFRSRIDVLISWFMSKEPINLGLLYIDEPDHTGHQHGPDSPEMAAMIKQLDGVLKYLIDQLKENHLWDDMNLIVTSDHGMTSTPPDKNINIDDYVQPDWYRVFSGNPVALILPNKDKGPEVYNRLKQVPHVTVYWKKDIPRHYHYKENGRILPILLVADPHYSLSFNGSVINGTVGNHGYNNSFPDMHPIFMAYGPEFMNKTIRTFPNTAVYPMMAYVLDIPPAPNNGSLDAIMALLKAKEATGGITVAYFVLIPLVLCVAAILSVAACHQRNFTRRVLKGPGVYPGYPSTSLQTALMSASEEEE